MGYITGPMSLAAHMADVRALHARALAADLQHDDEVVHDLRVALRRCRSLAQGLAAVDLTHASSWKALSAQAKTLFDGLGALRDAQVMIEHATRLLPGNEVVHARLQAPIAGLVAAAADVVAAFDVAAWDERSAAMPPRAEAALRRRPVLLHLALTRYDEARALHVLAMRRRTPEALHTTRIGVKRLRYTLESLLPDVHDVVHKPLKKMQELLGDLHDLDVLGDVLVDAAVDAAALDVVRAARADVLAAYKAVAVGRASAWTTIRRALPVDKDVIDRCARAFVVDVAASLGVDGKVARRCERAAIALSRTVGVPVSPLLRCAALLAPAKKKARKRAVRRLLGFSDDDKAAMRLALRSPVLVAARAAIR